MDIKIFLYFNLFSFLILTLPNQPLNQTQIGEIQHNIISHQQGNYNNQSSSTLSILKENKSSTPLIYGVRWSLGDYFSFTNLDKSHLSNIEALKYPQNINYYILAFNSYQKLSDGPFLDIVGTIISCSYSKISVPFSNDHNYLLSSSTSMNSTDAHIYKCYVNMDLRKTTYKNSDNQDRFEEFPYQIFVHQKNKTKRNFNQVKNLLVKRSIFNCTFRSPLPKLDKLSKLYLNSDKQQRIIQQKAVVFGDWSIISKQTQQSKGYFSILQSVTSRIQKDKNLVLTVFLGDLAYDFVSDNYYPTLLNLQSISSRICFMATPGNHEYYYHSDSFQIFAQTFFSPQWSKYFNSYYTFILGDFLFISYQPQNTGKRGGQSNIKPIQYMLNDFYNGEKVNSQQTSKPLSKQTLVNNNYEVIVFSHYPVICSKLDDSSKSCQNKKKLKHYLNTFNDIGMDLYLAAHVHYYDRTHCLCWKQRELNFSIEKPSHSQIYSESNQTITNEIYLSKCPIYLVEGGGGNQYFVQPEDAVKPLQVTSKLGFKTGYGILSMKSQLKKNIKQKRKQILNSIEFSHYKMIKRNQSKLWDRFNKILPVLSHNFVEINMENQQRLNISEKNHKKPLKKDDNYFKQVIIVSFIGTLGLIVILTFIFKRVRIYLKRYKNIDLNEEKEGQKSQKYIIKEEKK